MRRILAASSTVRVVHPSQRASMTLQPSPSEAANRSIAEEIRVRLERSFDLDTLDEASRRLADVVALIPAEVEKETGAAWHKHLGAWETFHEAIRALFALPEKPTGSAKFSRRPHQSCDDDDPKFLGRWITMKLLENRGWTNSPERLAMERTFQQRKQLKEKKS
jgi:hypothetical protein